MKYFKQKLILFSITMGLFLPITPNFSGLEFKKAAMSLGIVIIALLIKRNVIQCPYLHFFLNKGYTTIVKILIKLGTDLNIQDKDKNTVLHLAVKNRNKEILKVLVKAGADLNAWNKDGVNPFKSAIFEKSTEMVKIMADKFFKVHADENSRKNIIIQGIFNDNYPLYYAMRKDRTEMVRILLSALDQSNIDKTIWIYRRNGLYPRTILHVVVDSVQPEMLRILLEEGKISPNIRGIDEFSDRKGISPLQSCVNGFCTENSEIIIIIIDLLFKAGVDLNDFDELGTPPLFKFAFFKQEKLAKKLLALGANPFLGSSKLCQFFDRYSRMFDTPFFKFFQDTFVEKNPQTNKYCFDGNEEITTFDMVSFRFPTILSGAIQKPKNERTKMIDDAITEIFTMPNCNDEKFNFPPELIDLILAFETDLFSKKIGSASQ